MGHQISAAAQVKALAKAVSAAFAASNLTQEEKAPGKIEITDLPWTAPPLITDQVLSGTMLQDHFDAPANLDERTIHTFWTKSLHDMWTQPGRLIKRGAFLNCAKAMPKVKIGQRAFMFSQPAGYPAQLEDNAGTMFSLEVAHAARTSLQVAAYGENENDYWVQLHSGVTLGVKDGKSLCDTPWNRYDARGQVPDMLTMYRGDTTHRCDFDQIASLRSVLHVHRKAFPKNFEALEQALQALRILTMGTYCPELVAEMREAPMDAAVARERERVYREALEVVTAEISDRAKLQTWHALLVPAVMTGTGFRRHIFAGQDYPFCFAAGKLEQIAAELRRLYETQVPVDLQRPIFNN